MKKNILITLLCVLLLCSCSTTDYYEPNSIEIETDRTWYYDEEVAAYTPENLPDLVIDENLAYEIAKAVMEKDCPTVQQREHEVVIGVFKPEKVFIVSWYPLPIRMGGDYNIAISAENGAILGIWMGE